MIDREGVRAKIAEVLRHPVSRITDDAELRSLVQDSFVLVEMVIELQESFGFRLVQDDLREVRTVGDLLRTVEAKSKR
jgi:acyl carrier protein